MEAELRKCCIEWNNGWAFLMNSATSTFQTNVRHLTFLFNYKMLHRLQSKHLISAIFNRIELEKVLNSVMRALCTWNHRTLNISFKSFFISQSAEVLGCSEFVAKIEFNLFFPPEWNLFAGSRNCLPNDFYRLRRTFLFSPRKHFNFNIRWYINKS